MKTQPINLRPGTIKNKRHADRLRDSKTGLTLRQKKFCRVYLKNGYKQIDAAKAAGFAPSCAPQAASRYLKDYFVQQYINTVIKAVEEKFNITFEEKMKLLWECAHDCKNGKTNKEGYVNAQGLVSAVAELNKMQGHYHQAKEVEPVDDAKVKTLIAENEKEY
jgi:phage terminase small subunit